MSETVSFVAREELAEWLESRADAEMKTVSSLVQDIVAEDYRRKAGEETPKGGNGEPAEEPEDVFDRNPKAWYHPNSQKHDYAVSVPADEGVHDEGKTRYYKTKHGAAEALKRWYE